MCRGKIWRTFGHWGHLGRLDPIFPPLKIRFRISSLFCPKKISAENTCTCLTFFWFWWTKSIFCRFTFLRFFINLIRLSWIHFPCFYWSHFSELFRIPKVFQAFGHYKKKEAQIRPPITEGERCLQPIDSFHQTSALREIFLEGVVPSKLVVVLESAVSGWTLNFGDLFF